MQEDEIHGSDGIEVDIGSDAVVTAFHACCFKCGKREKAIIDLSDESHEVEFKKLLHVPQNGVFICISCAKKANAKHADEASRIIQG
jgi:hypothetical protein